MDFASKRLLVLLLNLLGNVFILNQNSILSTAKKAQDENIGKMKSKLIMTRKDKQNR